ncbi:MAG: radical SAM protein, partial [Bacteroidales bacterium]
MYKHLFGPVPSRRLGMSLGVDLVPHKVCTLNCVYCECGATTNLTTNRKEYVSYNEIINELKDYFGKNEKPDYITFSGAGEPTLNIHIGKVIDFLKQNYPDIPIAVLTNGSLLSDQKVRSELLKASLVLPSLDAANNKTFKKIDRPSKDLDINDYINGLIQFSNEFKGKIWLEIMILPK